MHNDGIPEDLLAKLNSASAQAENARSGMNDMASELSGRNEMMSSLRGRRPRREEQEEFDAFNNIDIPIEEEIQKRPERTGSSQRVEEDFDRPLKESRGGPWGRIRENVEENIRFDEPSIEEPNMQAPNVEREPRRSRSRDIEDMPNEFLDDEEAESSSGPLSIDRPQEPRRRPAMDDDDEDFKPKKRKKVDGESILSKIKLKPKYIAIIIGVVVFFALGAFLDKTQNDSNNELLQDVDMDAMSGNTSGSASESDYAEESEGVAESESSQQVTTIEGGTSVERGELYNDTTVEYSKDVYGDEIAVSKFLEIRGGSCIPKFMGYSSVLGKEIEFQVSPSTYNKYLNGVKINIEYRSVQKDGVTYVTDIKIVQ